jgi:uncharacterized protein (TIGR02466 family)
MVDALDPRNRADFLNRAALEANFSRVRALRASGHAKEAEAIIRRAVERAAWLKSEGEVAQARLVLSTIVETFPGHILATHDLGALLADCGDDAAADPLLRAAWKMAPEQAQAQRSLARLLLRRGDLAAVATLATDILTHSPGNSFALALAAFVAVETGNSEGCATLLDFQGLVSSSQPAPPSGYSDIAAFNRDLTETLLSRTDLAHDPQNRTTRGGCQSGSLFPAKEGPLRALQDLIRAAVADYVRTLPEQRDNPFVGQRPTQLKLHGWATVLEREGFQIPHIHPSGWLSGVYYVSLPGMSEALQDTQAGWLIFGEPSSAFHAKARHPRAAIAPIEGSIVLFPSYFHHSTEPFKGTSPRISVAFDLIATE